MLNKQVERNLLEVNNIDVDFSAIDIKPENVEFCNQFNVAYLDILYDK